MKNATAALTLTSTRQVNDSTVFNVSFDSISSAVAAQQAVVRGEMAGVSLLSPPIALPTAVPTGPPPPAGTSEFFASLSLSDPAVVGGLCGAGALVVLFIVICCCYCRRKKNNVSNHGARKQSGGGESAAVQLHRVLGTGSGLTEQQVQFLALQELEMEWKPPAMRRPGSPPSRANDISEDWI
jgi:hypothetical protein